MANRRWLNDRKTVGFESSKKSVNIRVHDPFFLIIFLFFLSSKCQSPRSPPSCRPCACTPIPLAEFRSPVCPVRRDRAAGRVEIGKIVRKSVECYRIMPFCSIQSHRFAIGRFHVVQHARNPHTPPHKPTEINDARLTRSRTNKHEKTLDKYLEMW